jgi:AcrR family transcriptional regulator
VEEELEITRPTVYYYFKNKDEILFECVRIALEMIERASQEVIERGGSGPEQLVAVMRQYAEVMMQDFGICLVRVGDSPLPAESRIKLRRLQSNIDRKLRGLIEQGIREKAFAPCDPKLAGFTVGGALNSISRWYRPDGELTPQQIADHFVTFLMAGLELRAPATPLAAAPGAARKRANTASRVKRVS